MDDLHELGMDAYWRASTEVRKIILAHAERRVDSQIASLASLNQRLTGVCALLFAGAALSTGIVTSAKVTGLPVAVAAAAACVFALGGVIALTGLHSNRTFWAGDAPSWWGRNGLETVSELDAEKANFWLADHYEEVIAAVGKATRRRARHLNLALKIGAVAGGVVALAAVMSAAESWPWRLPAPTPQAQRAGSPPADAEPTSRRVAVSTPSPAASSKAEGSGSAP